jgi:hypothetical protein
MQLTDTIASLWPLLKPHIPDADPKTHILVLSHQTGQFSHASTLSFSAIPHRPVHFLLFQRVVRCLVKTADHDPREYPINVSDSVMAVVNSIVGETENTKYALGFRSRDPGPIDKLPLQICCPFMPLVTQNWFHDPLFLIRRICEQDIEFLADFEVRQMLLRNFRLSALENISFYATDEWANLAALQLVWEGHGHATRQYIKATLPLYVSPVRPVDDSLVDQTQNLLSSTYENFTKDQAQSLYLTRALMNGCQCSYVTKVRFRREKSAWRTDRYLVVSPKWVWVLKDLHLSPEIAVLFGSWQDFTRGKKSVKVTFSPKEIWHIECKRPDILLGVLHPMFAWTENMATKAKDPVPRRASFDGQPVPFVSSEVRSKARIPRGMPICVLPSPEEADTPFCLRNGFRKLIVSALSDSERGGEVRVGREMEPRIFFKIPSEEMWYHNSFIMMLCSLLFLVLAWRL